MAAAPLRLKTAAENGLADIYALARGRLPGGARTKASRAAAFDAFALRGLPSSRIEAWKYTDLRKLITDAKPLSPTPGDAARVQARNAGALFRGLDVRRLVVVNGVFAPELSDLENLERGLAIGSTAEGFAADDPLLADGFGAIVPADEPLLALNAALAADGVVIAVAPGAVVARPIHIVFVTTSGDAEASYTRSLMVVGNGAQATLIETHEGPKGLGYQVNSALHLAIEDDASFEHVRVTDEGSLALHVGSLIVSLGARVRFHTFSFVRGGRTVRNQIFARFSGEAVRAAIRGVSLLGASQHADATLVIDHANLGGESRELFKSVLDGDARSVFQGKITVRQAAQKTDAKMMARALLLSDKAEADCKPELEIFADDVQCGHGATVGALDDQLKFYLMARGIPAKEAEGLLIQAFTGEAVDAIAHEGVREALREATLDWLARRG